MGGPRYGPLNIKIVSIGNPRRVTLNVGNPRLIHATAELSMLLESVSFQACVVTIASAQERRAPGDTARRGD